MRVTMASAAVRSLCSRTETKVGGAMLEPCLDALANKGRLVEITASQRRVEFDLLNFYRRELVLRGVNTLALDSAAGAGILGRLAPGFESGHSTSNLLHTHGASAATSGG